MPTADMGFTPKQTKQLMELAEKTMKGDKEAEADLMLETPTEFMEKMNVKEQLAKNLRVAIQKPKHLVWDINPLPLFSNTFCKF